MADRRIGCQSPLPSVHCSFAARHFSAPIFAGASGHGIERANRGCVASGVPQVMGTIRDEFAPSSARAPHGRVGQRPRTSVGPVVQLKRLSARAKTHFALDPFRAGSAAEEPLAPWVRTEVPPETQARPARPRSYNRHEKWRSQGVTEAVCFITSTL